MLNMRILILSFNLLHVISFSVMLYVICVGKTRVIVVLVSSVGQTFLALYEVRARERAPFVLHVILYSLCATASLCLLCYTLGLLLLLFGYLHDSVLVVQ